MGKNTTQNQCSSFSWCGYVHRSWTSQGGQLVFIANSELLQCRESNMSLIVARSSSGAETQAAADGDDEAVYVRLCLREVLFGQLDLQNWHSETRQIPANLVVDCRGVYDALARSSSSCPGLKDKKSCLEALALKQSLVECGTMIRWCYSAAQLGDVVTKDSDSARAPWELFVRRGFRWKLIHVPKFESSRNRANRGLVFLEEPDQKRVCRRRSTRSEECHVDYVKCMFSQIFATFLLAHLFWTSVPCIT